MKQIIILSANSKTVATLQKMISLKKEYRKEIMNKINNSAR